MSFNSIFRILANVHLWGLGLSIKPHILPYARAFFLNLCKRERGQDPKCAINLNLENLFFKRSTHLYLTPSVIDTTQWKAFSIIFLYKANTASPLFQNNFSFSELISRHLLHPHFCKNLKIPKINLTKRGEMFRLRYRSSISSKCYAFAWDVI